MYKEIIELMENKGIQFEEGLSENEIIKIQELYQFIFPNDYKIFLKKVLPISVGFYNWRDFSDDNIKYIHAVMQEPFNNLRESIKDIYWCEKWGEEFNKKEQEKIIFEKINNAPKLIPIFSHRYIPIIDAKESPIISIRGIDVICYGENLNRYLFNEFVANKPIDLVNSIEYIPFWSDIM